MGDIFNGWPRCHPCSVFGAFHCAALEKIALGKNASTLALHVVVIFAINFVPTAFGLFKQTASSLRLPWHMQLAVVGG